MSDSNANLATCKEPGRLVPVVNRNRCEAKSDCIDVCPYQVFEMRTLSAEDKRGLSLIGRLKSLPRGYKQAYVIDPDRCHGCGLCVKACPEKAIKLKAVESA